MKETLKTNFKKINKLEYYNDMFVNNEVDKESVIESVFNNWTIMTTNGKVKITKRGWTDGVMKFGYINGKDPSHVNFYGLQECKRKVKLTNTQLCKQLLQSLKYYNDYFDSTSLQNKFKVFCLNSEKFYCYIYFDELPEDFINEIIKLIKASSYSASVAWKDPSLKCCMETWAHKLPFHVKKMIDEVKLDEIFTEIYRHCA